MNDNSNQYLFFSILASCICIFFSVVVLSITYDDTHTIWHRDNGFYSTPLEKKS